MLWVAVITQIVLMSALLICAVSFLLQSCRSKQKTAGFIVKLLVLIVLVSSGGLADAIHEAPWLQQQVYYNDTVDIIITSSVDYIFWVAA